MKIHLTAWLCVALCSLVHAEDKSAYRQDAALWYRAFNQQAPALLDRILSENWVDVPAPPNQPAGRAGAKALLVELTTTFPDLNLTIKDVLQKDRANLAYRGLDDGSAPVGGVGEVARCPATRRASTAR